MIRAITRPATAAGTLPKYIGFLLSEPNAVSCVLMGQVLEMSHDSVNRFLYREKYSPQDLFNETKRSIDLTGGTLSVDDSVLDKPYANHIAFVDYFYSLGNKGIRLIKIV